MKENGELIFITPEYWLKNLHSQKLRNYIISKCFIKEIYYLNEIDIFKNVKSSFIIIKIVKQKINPKIKIYKIKKEEKNLENIFYNKKRCFDFFEIDQFKFNKKWLLYEKKLTDECYKLENSCSGSKIQKELFETNKINTLEKISTIANGLVSGYDKAFLCDDNLYDKLNKKEKAGLVKIVKSKNLSNYKFNGYKKYIFLNNTKIKNFKKDFPNLFFHFKNYKSKLNKRYDYKNNINYWEWSFLRSYEIQKSNKKKICIPCKLRIKDFRDIKFSLIDEKYLLSQDVTSIFINADISENIKYILAFLNSTIVKKWIFINNNNRGNVLEFSEEPLKNIPIRLINWKNKKEVKIYKKIIEMVNINLKNYNDKNLSIIDDLINLLLGIKKGQ